MGCGRVRSKEELRCWGLSRSEEPRMHSGKCDLNLGSLHLLAGVSSLWNGDDIFCSLQRWIWELSFLSHQSILKSKRTCKWKSFFVTNNNNCPERQHWLCRGELGPWHSMAAHADSSKYSFWWPRDPSCPSLRRFYMLYSLPCLSAVG